jgi:hypothetical protein
MLAVQANGKKITTVEGLTSTEMEIVKDCFVKNNAMQCGFCSSGMLMTTYEIIKSKRKHSREEIREIISGNYCRCTGYQAIVDAVEDSLSKINEEINLVFFGTGDRPNEAPKTCDYLLKNEYNYSDIRDLLKNDIDFASDISSSSDMKAHLSAILVGRMMKELN